MCVRVYLKNISNFNIYIDVLMYISNFNFNIYIKNISNFNTYINVLMYTYINIFTHTRVCIYFLKNRKGGGREGGRDSERERDSMCVEVKEGGREKA